MSKKTNLEYSSKDFEFMNSLSAAILEQTPSRISKVVKIWLITVILFIAWASFASIDEVTRGDGKVVPFGQNQVIQNLEGGIVESILVREGQQVTKGQTLIKINNSKTTSTSLSNRLKSYELLAKKQRLLAEANGQPFKMIQTDDPLLLDQLKLAKALYNSRKKEQKTKDLTIIKQIAQKNQEIKEAKAKLKALRTSYKYVAEEIKMTAPMVKEGIKSKVDFLKLKREANDIQKEILATKLSLPRLEYVLEEYNNKRKELREEFLNKVKEELNEVSAELERINSQQIAYNDQIQRTMVTSPVNGIVQKLYVHTIGGVIKPGADLVEVVPTTDKLYLEIKIKPSDIAFIHPGAQAMVKVSAYDFAIYGGLHGKVVHISPDSITDKKDKTYYLIYIETEKNYLGTKEHPLNIIPGMMANVDIVTGKKTVLQYILKPILKSKQYVFSER